MSKASRRQQRQAKTSTGSTGASGSSGATPGATPRVPASSTPTSHTPGVRPSTGVGSPARATRRPSSRTSYQRPFVERYRGAIIASVAGAAIILVGLFVFTSSTRAAYTCSTQFSPAPTASPATGSSPQPGYLQDDMGHLHVAPGDPVTYTFCPPASGNHVNVAGLGPIAPRFYGPNDKAIPEGWIHNLEHGGLVLLYKGDGPGATADGQAALRAFYGSFPASPVCGFAAGTNVSPVIARFDDMAWPYAALVWGRVLPLQTLDTAAILAFNNAWGEKTNPEQLCSTPPSASPSASASASGSGAAAPSASASGSASPSAAPSVTPSPAPSTTPAPSASPSPS